MEPASSPDRIRRPRKIATKIIGIMEIKAATEIAHHSSPRLEFCPAIRMGSVCHFEEVKSSAKRNSFQIKARMIIDVATRPGLDMGNTI